MNRDLAMKIADAVLYEGYILYPYRRSALKNRQRWTFGILYPPDYQDVLAGTERSSMHSECLLETNGPCNIYIELRFLHSISKTAIDSSSDALDKVKVMERWEEASPRSIEFQPDLNISRSQRCEFSLPATTCMSELSTQTKVMSKQDQVQGVLTFCTERLAHNVLKISIHLANETQSSAGERDRNCALSQALLSAHLILSTENGEFISLLDPPEGFRAYVAGCNNIGNFPVLLGTSGEHDMMLCSPIILYDFPQIAPESAGDFYDATEMDEMLTLRVMTLTDEEKRQILSADDRARALLQRTEQSAREHLMKTHGVIRNLRYLDQPSALGKSMNWNESEQPPVESIVVFGVQLKLGDPVRLWPQKTADIMDIALKGKIGVVEAIERDFDDQIHVAVVLEEDPGRDLGMLRQPGHRFFFSPEELEPLAKKGELRRE